MSDLIDIHYCIKNGGLDRSKYQSEEEYILAKKNLFLKRYNDVYKASPLILAQLMYEENNPSLNEYITRQTGITTKDAVMSFRRDKVNLLLRLEEHFIDRYGILPSSLELFCWDLLYGEALPKLRKKIENMDEGFGENIYDKSMRTLLNILYQYVRCQGKSTRVYDVFNTVEPHREKNQGGIDKSFLKDEFVCKKLIVLEKYLELANYHNSSLGISVDRDFPDASIFKVYRRSSLVGDHLNDEDYDRLITDKDIEDLYFMHHNEMKWNVSGKCQSNDVFKDKTSCGNDFYLSEEDVFHLDGHFYQMCPTCGCICDVSSSIVMEDVRNRIIAKGDKDEHLARKSSILSELYDLDPNYKTLVKKRGN